MVPCKPTLITGDNPLQLGSFQSFYEADKGKYLKCNDRKGSDDRIYSRKGASDRLEDFKEKADASKDILKAPFNHF